MKAARRSLSLTTAAVERVEDLRRVLVEDFTEPGNLSLAELVTALVFAAPAEPAGLSRLVRFGRMEQLEEPDGHAYAQCERTAVALGWRERVEA